MSRTYDSTFPARQARVSTVRLVHDCGRGTVVCVVVVDAYRLSVAADASAGIVGLGTGDFRHTFARTGRDAFLVEGVSVSVLIVVLGLDIHVIAGLAVVDAEVLGGGGLAVC